MGFMLPTLRAKKSADYSGRQQPTRFEGRLLASVLSSGVPGIALSLVLLWYGSYSLDHKLEFTLLAMVLWLVLSVSTRDAVVNSLRGLSNVVAAMKDEDFSFRATEAISGDALGDLAVEINSLSYALAEERLGSLETANLLRKVMAEAGAIIFAFSADERVRIINRAGLEFLRKKEEGVLNHTAQELGIQDLLEGSDWEVVSRPDSGGEKRWIIRRARFRQQGQPHRLILLTEASEALRAEERLAWQRLIRVLSHEINNSLAPIKTIAGTLGRMSSNAQLPRSLAEDLGYGLGVIRDRADSLGRFLQSYAQLAKLPTPTRRVVSLGDLMERIATLEPRLAVKIIPGSNVLVEVDPDQIEQALINLVKNATDSVLLVSEKNIGPEAVTLSWSVHSHDVEILVRDEGLGLTKTENLFVPFFTTKESGSGIGLLLSRQIIEAHHGTLVLKNRLDRPGCLVEIRLATCVVESSQPSRLTADI